MLTIKTVGIIAKPGIAQAERLVPELIEWLEARGINTRCDEYAAAYASRAEFHSRERVPDGADLVIVAVSARGIVDQAIACSRPGSRILLFAQTSATERIETSGADICVGERSLLGCYSASVDLQSESANLVFGGEIPVEELISHRLPLVKIRSGIDLALHPGPNSLKIIVQPQRWS